MCDLGELSCTGKLVRVVLDNRGPLSPTEIADEANIATDEAITAIEQLESADFARPVCGLCESQEEVFTLTEEGEAFDPPEEEGRQS